MALFTETLVSETLELVRRRHAALGAALGVPQRQESPAGPLRAQLQLLVRVANGELLRASAPDAQVLAVEAALAALLDALLGNALHAPSAIPDAFWRTPVGSVASRARWWLSADELITISNAAALAFGENSQANRMRIARAIDSGLLDWVPDPSVANPQQNKRVLRPQVERLREQRRLPE